MKKMKRVLAILAILALSAGILSSCLFVKKNDPYGRVTESQIQPQTVETLPDESETGPATEPASEPASESGTASETEPASDPDSETDPEPATEPASDPEPVELPSAEELEAFLSTPGVNGFLASTYSDVRDASLREVIYQTNDEEIPYEDVVAVLEKKHGHELMSSVSYISAEGLQALVLERTGRSLDEFRCDLSEYYLSDEDLDIYYVEHGDTNMQPVKVLDVGEESGKIVVRYTTSFGSDWFWVNEGGQYGSAAEMEVVLIRSGDGFRFVSNQPAA